VGVVRANRLIPLEQNHSTTLITCS
jgi:hypothetical protein